MTAALEFLANLVMGAFGLTMLILISLADRFGKKDVAAPPRLRPGEENLYIGHPLVVDRQKRYNRALSDRIEMMAKRAARPATREKILAAQDQKRAMALIRDAGGC